MPVSREVVDCPTCNTRYPVVANGVRAEVTSVGVFLVETICHECDARTIWRVRYATYRDVRLLLRFIDETVVYPFARELSTTDLLVEVLEDEKAQP